MDEITKDDFPLTEKDSEAECESENAESNTDVSESIESSANDQSITKENTIDNADDEESIDYDKVIEEDIALLKNEFPELAALQNITELENPIRYAALRDLGLSATEAYLATTKRVRRDNRSHLTTAYGKNATPPTATMSQRELSEARALFGNLSDLEIQRLYKRVKERS